MLWSCLYVSMEDILMNLLISQYYVIYTKIRHGFNWKFDLKEHDHFIRQVRQTGVTLITNKARKYGFGSPDEEGLWANFGQGAPEVGPIPGAPEKSMTFTMDEVTME